MKKGFITFTTLTVLAVCASFQLVTTHRLSTAGIELTEIETQIQTLLKENEELRHTIASHSSLMTVSVRAKELGFREASVFYVEKPPIARAQ